MDYKELNNYLQKKYSSNTIVFWINKDEQIKIITEQDKLHRVELTIREEYDDKVRCYSPLDSFMKPDPFLEKVKENNNED